MKDAVDFLSHRLNACPCIIADNDPTGKDGAGLLAGALLEARIPCRLLIVPEPHKDLRDWLRRGLTTKELKAGFERQPIEFPDNHSPGFIMLPNNLVRQGLLKELTGTECSVLVCITSFRDGTGLCWPDREKIAELCRVTPRTVDRAKQKLRELGLLSWQRGGTGRANEYQVDFGPVKGSRRKHRVRPALTVSVDGE